MLLLTSSSLTQLSQQLLVSQGWSLTQLRPLTTLSKRRQQLRLHHLPGHHRAVFGFGGWGAASSRHRHTSSSTEIHVERSTFHLRERRPTIGLSLSACHRHIVHTHLRGHLAHVGMHLAHLAWHLTWHLAWHLARHHLTHGHLLVTHQKVRMRAHAVLWRWLRRTWTGSGAVLVTLWVTQRRRQCTLWEAIRRQSMRGSLIDKSFVRPILL